MIRELMCTVRARGSNGTVYTLKVFRNLAVVSDALDLGEPSADPANWDYFASIDGRGEGRRVRRLDKGRYQFVDTAVTLSSDDPSAP